MRAVALTIAGSDPSGGAGIQADLKTFHQFGVYGEAAVTLLTVQNTRALSRVEIMPAGLVKQQVQAVIDDIPPAAAKTGALGNAAVVETMAKLAATFTFPLIVDPVMISKHGARLISPEAEKVLKQSLLPHAFLVTPNIPEAESLTGMKIRDENDMRSAMHCLRDLGAHAALIKGGHASGDPVDILSAPGQDSCERFPGARIETRHTHGTGCTYSAAITAGLALGYDLCESIRIAKSFIQAAIQNAPNLGAGYGPVNHFAEPIQQKN
ncbi:MAG: bifunctional hydroxymethylpyrimidine kinase/phosphomethylpyrimidine kinase [Acidobacteriaceae bacterium]|nr:bifunctional hydroxymethylpyrimidine kinase/phosphomethylpyrimidine kinase [Acidobacteriaceae bacterium]MBV9780133.1 bifunctional hydroxymethylpyrimidine kinase/phosphomethylpyrimidine kinase [Acidobacteriaceae bacterium]